MNEPTFHCGNSDASIIDIPLVPPNAKWFGVLKIAIPAAVAKSPKFKRRKNHILLNVDDFMIRLPLPHLLIKAILVRLQYQCRYQDKTRHLSSYLEN